MKNLKKNFLILGITTLSILSPIYIFTLMELLSRPRNSEIQRIERNERLKIEIPEKIRLYKKGFMPNFIPKQTRNFFFENKFYPVGTLPHTKTAYCNEGYGVVSYESDRFGLRNLDENWDLINSLDTTYFVGDSFVAGACVNDEFTFPKVYEDISGDNVINLGNSGNTPYEYIAILRQIVSPIINTNNQNKKIVLVFYDNDNKPFNAKIEKLAFQSEEIAIISKDQSIQPKEEYVKLLKNVIKENYPDNKIAIIKKLKEEQEELKDKVNTYYFKNHFLYQLFTLVTLRKRINFLLNINPYNANKCIGGRDLCDLANSPSVKAIKTLKTICNQKDSCSPLVVYIPNSAYWRNNQLSRRYFKHIKDAAKIHKITFLDSSKVIDKNSKKDYAPSGPHLSKEGYQKLAKFLNKELNY